MNIIQTAEELKKAKENIILIYAFNATGKTRLSVEYKNISKEKNKHTGVYYNAYSEDLFYWNNDEENNNADQKLVIVPSSLNKFHSLLKEDDIKEKLIPFNPTYNFYFNSNDETSDYNSISFFKDGNEDIPIKISRGEERIFVWCFFLALFEVEGWADVQNKHIFIDDPVSSLDDNNIFITARLILNLLERHCDDRKIIIATHHMGLFSILHDWMKKGENSSKFTREKITKKTIKLDGKKHTYDENSGTEPKYLIRFLERTGENYVLKGKSKGQLLYHILIMKTIDEAVKRKDLNTYHFVLLRQVIESIASFLGEGRFSYVLDKIKIAAPTTKADVINALSHEKIYNQKLSVLKKEDEDLFVEVFDQIKTIVPFSI